MRRNRRAGFTLSELLILIAIVVILAALLLPVVTAVRARARGAVCASHLRQLALAGSIYLSDYDGRFPSCYFSASSPVAIDLCVTLAPYVRCPELFYCPDRHSVSADCLDRWGRWGGPARCMGYGYNWGSGIGPGGSAAREDGLVRPGVPFGMLQGVMLAEVRDGARCFFLGDTNDQHLLSLWREAMPGVRARRDHVGPGSGAAPEEDLYEPPRHSGGNNFAFVDGHVRWLPFVAGPAVDGGPQVVPDLRMYARAPE
jgi:prepilin-type processing-associated H-X9-DG protein